MATSRYICEKKNCRFFYRHFFDMDICGPVPNSNATTARQPKPAPDLRVKITNDCCAANVPAQAEQNRTVHMYPAEGVTACETKLDDGRNHTVTSKIDNVTCDTCKIRYYEYIIDELKTDVLHEKEKVRVAEQATRMVRRELRTTTLNANRQRRDIRDLKEELVYLRQRFHHSPMPGLSRDRYPY